MRCHVKRYLPDRARRYTVSCGRIVADACESTARQRYGELNRAPLFVLERHPNYDLFAGVPLRLPRTIWRARSAQFTGAVQAERAPLVSQAPEARRAAEFVRLAAASFPIPSCRSTAA